MSIPPTDASRPRWSPDVPGHILEEFAQIWRGLLLAEVAHEQEEGR